MVKINKKIPVVHKGDAVMINNTRYDLSTEVIKGCCCGCAFENINFLGCKAALTDICRQGFIFIKKN